MRFRIGYGGPKRYRHGQHFPGGRPNNGNMTEIERLIHLIASMQILFGSRKGGLLIPLLIVAALAGGWFIYRAKFSPNSELERAHQMWESNETRKQILAIKNYKDLLLKSDPIEPNRHFLMDDRDTLYRRIIRHEFKFEENKNKAGEWIIRAWDEGLRERDLRFQADDSDVKEFWTETTDEYSQKNQVRKNRSRSKSKKPEPEDGKFDLIPGIDNGSLDRLKFRQHRIGSSETLAV